MTNQNSFTPKKDAAAALGRALSASSRRLPQQQQLDDPFAQAIAQRLQDKGIAQVPGLPQPPEPEWFDKAIAYYNAANEDQRQANEQHQTAPVNIVELIRATLEGLTGGPVTEPVKSTVPALNSVDILRAALGGSSGTVNGEVIQGGNG
ncbi:MAG: hypothetical protein WA622_27075 [Mycobacterium sp.]|uniref:hypothetical protein n=1 Tax=Mycobacterium sp. TaxID=1785 RepID=UPI003BB5A2B5